MATKKKVGILGGTFDPIHTAHLILAENAYEQFHLDTVLIMPCGTPPHKPCRIIADTSHRIKMIQLAIEDNKHLKLSTFETERSGKSYTALTLQDLTSANPACRYYFIIGADSLFHIEEWYKPELIMKHAVLLAAIRDQTGEERMHQQIAYLTEKFHAEIHLMHTPNIGISSSMVRERIRSGINIKYFVPRDVEKYIYNNRLYTHAE